VPRDHPELTLGHRARLVGRDAALDVLGRLHLDVESHLVLEVPLERTASEQQADAAGELPKGLHERASPGWVTERV